MQFIIDFFKNFTSILENIITFVTTLIKSLIDFILMLPQTLQMLTGSIAFLPGELILFATVSLTVSIIFIILGRGAEE